MKITEYTLVELEGVGKKYYSIKLGEGMYYQSYSHRTGIQVTHDIGFASRITSEQFALETIGFLQNFFNDDGTVKPDKVDLVIPPLVGLAEAADMLEWSKQRIVTYLARGVFPEPIRRLASGPIWTHKQIEDYRDSR